MSSFCRLAALIREGVAIANKRSIMIKEAIAPNNVLELFDLVNQGGFQNTNEVKLDLTVLDSALSLITMKYGMARYLRDSRRNLFEEIHRCRV